MNDVVNIFLCKDKMDVIASMTNYADNQKRFGENVKAIRSRATVVVNGSWVTKFVSSPKALDGMHVREITVSTRMSTAGELSKLKDMLNMARQGRIAMKNAQM
ncbi:hypothetical protein GCM10025879_20050 [Leuconostoc litchii]|uniref:Uncharacterized protein n=1 Tax=Leuconostoc litchii TaxID=1981069 RepID=A0A6P2CRH4_9LACO|nr:hypothetical protein [Leuconostoc litchii]TYC46859.1 hypothetical protein ESZ47_01580 [Leuconostoc litchii]GMA68761.1 hypothetical protein GCM10025879_00070 [Leuconostoc litchii]GMA70759.1 hypothetical protein GCM10025879_20050 [Leuconostoc litchii]